MIRYKGPVFPATGRGRRAITAAAKGIGLGVVFLLAAAGGAVLHLGLPAPRRFVTARVNSLLDGTINGKVVIRRLDRIRLTRLEGIDAEVFDPEGRRVLLVHDAQARIGTGTLLRSLVSGDSLLIRIPELRVGWAEVVLEENAAGELGLQRAFVSRAPATGKPSRGTCQGWPPGPEPHQAGWRSRSWRSATRLSVPRAAPPRQARSCARCAWPRVCHRTSSLPRAV